jgi:hypothetical protein
MLDSSVSRPGRWSTTPVYARHARALAGACWVLENVLWVIWPGRSRLTGVLASPSPAVPYYNNPGRVVFVLGPGLVLFRNLFLPAVAFALVPATARVPAVPLSEPACTFLRVAHYRAQRPLTCALLAPCARRALAYWVRKRFVLTLIFWGGG